MYRYIPSVLRTTVFFLLTQLFTSLASLAATEQDKYLLVYYRQSASGNYDFYAKNLNYCPYQLQIEFSKLISAEVTTPLPYYTVIQAQSNEQYLFSIRPKDEAAFSFKFAYNYWLGDPEQVVSGGDQTDYVLPYRAGTSLKVTQGYNGPYSHKDTYALDFELLESTAICAAKDGLVVQTKEDSKRGGPDKTFAKDCNYITVYQLDGTIAEYVHLKQNGSIVSVGDTIHAGQVIGYGGNTGWSTSPHLHFCVKQPIKMGYETIPVKFLSAKSKKIALESNHTYRAYPPAKDEQPAPNSWRNLFGLIAHSSSHSL
ncbi:MAG: M23 family metallopeptidase [Bacteroidota bacterium]